MLHARRTRLAELARREAEGESFWAPFFDARPRERLWVFLEDSLTGEGLNLLGSDVVALFRHDLGIVLPLVGDAYNAYVVEHAIRHEGTDNLPSLLEAIHISLHNLAEEVAFNFESLVNEITNEYRISFEMINGKMIERESQELHAEVVAPTLRLLSGRPGWDKVESAYQDALREISQNNPGDAITDAGTALQEALKLLGCDGNALGPLAKSARAKGILAPHDATLNDAVQKIIDWVSADRSETGDAHKASSATRDDAWLAVHVVGALLLRLAGNPRTAP